MKKKCLWIVIVLLMLVLIVQVQSFFGFLLNGEVVFCDYEKVQDYWVFVVVLGGVWGWNVGVDLLEQVEDKVFVVCQSGMYQKCVFYVGNEQVVFDVKFWLCLWGFYVLFVVVKVVVDGFELGKCMLDIVYCDVNGCLR